MATFGANLRRLRSQRAISQTDLGGDRFSASYISHLERGTRRPSAEVVSFLAERLAVPVDDLLDDLPDADVSATVSQVLMYEALSRHEYVTVEREAAGDQFAVLQVSAQAQLEQGDLVGCLDTTEDLLQSRVASSSPVLRAVALSTRSRALRADGQLLAARAAATEAVEATRAAVDCPAEVVVAARTAEIAALAERGETAALAPATEELARLAAELHDSHTRALAAWSVGNVRFTEGRYDEAIAWHDDAARLLRPEASLRAWARFHKASAELRIEAGFDTDVDAMIERAEHGLAIVGNADDLAELELLRASRLTATEPDRALEMIDDVLLANELPGQTIAESQILRATAFAALHRPDDQRAALERAAEAFTAAGAPERAVTVLREILGLQDSQREP